jgi:hypothetical protein
MIITTPLDMFQWIAALIAGALIGAGFGIMQDAARRRNERLQARGELASGWSVMPGAGKRVVFLLVALVLVQIVCPLFFHDNTRWWVSAGVALGYGLTLFWQLRNRLAGSK